MRIRKFQVSVILYFKSGNSKKVDWLEERLVKKVKMDEREVTESLTLEEADAFFQGKFKEWKDNGATIVRKNAKGDNSVIPFTEIEYATVAVSEVDDIPTPVSVPDPPAPPPVRSIKDHPAFRN